MVYHLNLFKFRIHNIHDTFKFNHWNNSLKCIISLGVRENIYFLLFILHFILFHSIYLLPFCFTTFYFTYFKLVILLYYEIEIFKFSNFKFQIQFLFYFVVVHCNLQFAIVFLIHSLLPVKFKPIRVYDNFIYQNFIFNLLLFFTVKF